ncbi:MAG: LacI family DNA-binding transcriptional regulator [Candidatus Hydrogenedentota bacterium]
MNGSISQIAREAGVSKMTISRVLNGHPHVSEKTRRKVQKIVRQRGFHVNLSARHLSRGTRFPMAAVVTGLEDLFLNNIYHALIRSIEDAMKQRGHAIALFNIPRTSASSPLDPTLELLAANFESLIFKSVILLGPPTHDSRIGFLADRGVRGLVVCSEKIAKGFGSIGVDNAEGIRMVVDHLVEHGHRRIGFVEGPRDLSDARERSAAFCATMKQRGLKVDRKDIVAGDFTREGGRHAAHHWVKTGELPDAIVAANDDMAAGLCDVFTQSGIRIPEQVSITGFDGTLLARQLDPALTTVAQPLAAIGEAVAEATVSERFDLELRLPPVLFEGRSVRRIPTE